MIGAALLYRPLPVTDVANHSSRWPLCARAAALGAVLAAAGVAPAQGPGTPAPQPQPGAVTQPPIADTLSAFEGRPIREVNLSGLSTPVNEQKVRNQLRSRPGQPLSAEIVRADIGRFTRLGFIRTIEAKVQPLADQSVVLTYVFTEARLIKDVQVVGNRQISDDEIHKEYPPLAGTAVDEFELGRATARIQELYRKKGYYLAEVTVDREELDKAGIVLFRIRERERVKVSDIRLSGNAAFADDQLFPNIHTKTSGLFETGPLDDEVLDQDVGAVIKFYKDRGYLDIRADREVRPSPDAREAIVTFIIDEGALYTLRSVTTEIDEGAGKRSGKPLTVFSTDQVKGLMLIKPGDAYSVDKLEKSIRAVSDAYGRLGHIEARINRQELRDPDRPQVDLLLQITEGKSWKVGLVKITGDGITKDNVVRRLIRVLPQRPADTTAMRDSKDLLDASRLFEGTPSPGGPPTSVRLTFQPPATPDSDERDVLVEVKETNTGSIGFGIGISSDSGVAGSLSVTQRNFDLFDLPESPEELFNGRAFRGGGQIFNLTLAPGTELQSYGVSITDPYLFDSNYSGSVAGLYATRRYTQYDEDRIGGQVSIGRRFGDRWGGAVTARVARVHLRNIDPGAPVDVFNDAGPDLITGLGVRISRSTYDRALRPTRGTKIDFAVEQVGAMGGNFTFTKLSAEHGVYIPIHEDFLGHFTVLSLRTAAAYIPQNAADTPVYERYYMGGRSFRGFDYRTISPKGIRHETMTQGTDPVGGTWSFFTGVELEQPIWQDMISGVVFIDSGTVTNSPGFGSYRVSTGFGLRIAVPQLGPVPLAFDFGFPLLRQDGDKSRLFSFSLDFPF